MTEMELAGELSPSGSLDVKVKRGKAHAAEPKEPRKTYLYVGYRNDGTWDTFSDELEAHRFAIKGADPVRVEKRELIKRSK